jgi:hypothetical protein
MEDEEKRDAAGVADGSASQAEVDSRRSKPLLSCRLLGVRLLTLAWVVPALGVAVDREERRAKLKRRMLANINFIGELYKIGDMLTPNIMHFCITTVRRGSDQRFFRRVALS